MTDNRSHLAKAIEQFKKENPEFFRLGDIENLTGKNLLEFLLASFRLGWTACAEHVKREVGG